MRLKLLRAGEREVGRGAEKTRKGKVAFEVKAINLTKK